MDKFLSQADLDAIKAREQKATKGPWHTMAGGGEVHTDHDHVVFIRTDEDGDGDPVIADLCTHPNWEADTAFITGARQDIPKLLAENDELRTLIVAFATALAAYYADDSSATLGEVQRSQHALQKAARQIQKATALPTHRFDCPTCGPAIAVDEDGCCRRCGADAVMHPPIQGPERSTT